MSESPQEKPKPETEPAPEISPETGAETSSQPGVAETGPESAAERAAETAAGPVAAPGRATRWRGAGLAFLVIIVVAGLVAWQWYQGRTESRAMREELARKLADADAKALAGRRVAGEARDAMSAVQGRIGALESRIGETQAVQAALEARVRELSRSREDWTVTEIEQALRVTSQRLQLSGDVTSALGALRTSQEKLQELARPELDALRQAISGDIARLQGLPEVDIAGISAQLDQLLARADELPLAMDVRPRPGARPDTAGGGEQVWVQLLRETWEELKQLVRIQRMDRPDIPLLAPSQAFFLRENLKLRLLSARLALLARDVRSYKADLGAARDWLRRYYDVREEAVASAIKSLSSLHDAELSPERPHISASLEAMRAYRRGRAAPKP